MGSLSGCDYKEIKRILPLGDDVLLTGITRETICLFIYYLEYRVDRSENFLKTDRLMIFAVCYFWYTPKIDLRFQLRKQIVKLF